MIERLAYLWPEIALFLATCVVMVVGLSPSLRLRGLCAPVSALGLVAAWILAVLTTPERPDPEVAQALLPNLLPYAKGVICAVGLLLLLVSAGAVDRSEERRVARTGARFDPLRTNRAEYWAFFLFSLTGLMLVASADDLIWLFLALELTSLPTYIMVTISGGSIRADDRSKEAGVKYFFLGALGAATFLYGFALLYGGTGTVKLNGIADAFAAQMAAGGLNVVAITGLVLALLGLCFKIAAVPMHFYVADVYEGAASPVSAFLAFVPKAAGFLAIVLLCAAAGWSFGPSGGALPDAVRVTLWVIAALTMSVGNVLALVQTSLKRLLAYSSVAHSGYMLVGVIAGPAGASATDNGLAAVLFYLLVYGVMTTGAFAVLAALERPGERAEGNAPEVETFDEVRGLCRTRPMLGWTLVLCSLSLLGLPPILGFFGKLPLFTSAIAAGEYVLLGILAVNSAIAAFYYLRIVATALLEEPEGRRPAPRPSPYRTRHLAAGLSAAGVVMLVVWAGSLLDLAGAAAGPVVVAPGEVEPAAPRPEERAAEGDADEPESPMAVTTSGR